MAKVPSRLSESLRSWVAGTMGVSGLDEFFSSRHLSHVVGYRLSDGRGIVVKARPGLERAARCVAAQHMLHRDGFPCPEPLSEVHEVDGLAVHAESYVPDGEQYLGTSDEVVVKFGELLVDLTQRLERLNPQPPEPPPPWLWWDHPQAEVFPTEASVEAREDEIPSWLSELAARVRERMASCDLPEVVSHGDWETQHLHWRADKIRIVHDWDSLCSRPEAALVGAAAATFGSERVQPVLAPLGASERFVESYEHRRGRPFTREEHEVAWAAGLWVAAHNARMEILYGKPPLVLEALRKEREERLRRAGA